MGDCDGMSEYSEGHVPMPNSYADRSAEVAPEGSRKTNLRKPVRYLRGYYKGRSVEGRVC